MTIKHIKIFNTRFKFLFYTLIATLFFQCQTEEVALHNHEESKFQKTEGSFEQFGLNQLTTKLRIYNQETNEKTNLKTQNQEGFYFDIDKDKVLKLTDGITESYTIRVSNNQTPLNSFQNLVIAKYKNLEPKAYLYTYFPDQDYLNRLKTDNDTHFSGKCNLKQLDYNKLNITTQSDCTAVTVYLCNQGGDVHAAGQRCTQVYAVSLVNCLDSPSGDTGGIDYTGLPGDNEGPGSSSNGNTQGNGIGGFMGIPTFVRPNIDLTSIYGEEIAFQYNVIQNNLFLNRNQIKWLGADPQRITLISNYLSQNNLTHEKKDFILKLINLAIRNNLNFNFDDNLNSTNSINIPNISEIQNYLDTQNSQTLNQPINTYLTLQTGEKISSCKIDIPGPIQMNIDINQTFNPYEIKSVNSEFIGITFGQNWKESTYTVNKLNGIATLDVYGNHSVSIFLDGIGTLLSWNEHYKIKINMQDGTIIAAYKI